jgi:hypothetical protein
LIYKDYAFLFLVALEAISLKVVDIVETKVVVVEAYFVESIANNRGFTSSMPSVTKSTYLSNDKRMLIQC